MHAILKSGGKQHKVKEGTTFAVEKINSSVGDVVELNEVLMLIPEVGESTIGQPLVSNAAVICEVIEQFRDKKISIVKFRRRKDSHTKTGHRQDMTRLVVKEIKTN